MKRGDITMAQRAATEFVVRCHELLEEMAAAGLNKPDDYTITGTLKSGAVRRMSLELTRYLAKMRKP